MPGADESEYPLRPCNHEEFDTRVLSHAANAVSRGYKRILTIANDTDWLGKEICLRTMEHTARAHNHALSSDG